MKVEQLSVAVIERLRSQSLTYAEIGQSLNEPPAGYAQASASRRLPTSVDFAAAAAAVLSWQVPAGSGLRVAASSLQVELDAVVLLRVGFGPAALKIPCRVVALVDEPDRQGFAYGTLPGHPESGEEAFVVERDSDGAVTLTVTAFSRPATVLARLGGPVASQVQRFMTHRYLHALG